MQCQSLQCHIRFDNSLIFIKSVSSYDIIKTFKTLNLKKTGDIWAMPFKLLNSFINDIAPQLRCIYQMYRYRYIPRSDEIQKSGPFI